MPEESHGIEKFLTVTENRIKYEETKNVYFEVELWEVGDVIVAELGWIQGKKRGRELFDIAMSQIQARANEINQSIRFELEPRTPSGQHFVKRLSKDKSLGIYSDSSKVYSGTWVYYLDILPEE